MFTRTRCLIFTVAAIAVAQLAVAQPSPAASAARAPLTEVIAVDPQVRVGRLPNKPVASRNKRARRCCLASPASRTRRT